MWRGDHRSVQESLAVLQREAYQTGDSATTVGTGETSASLKCEGLQVGGLLATASCIDDRFDGTRLRLIGLVR